MDLGTTLAIVIPNAVAALAIIVGWRQHGRGLKEGRRLADLEDVRSLLDDCAVVLHRAAYALDDVRLTLTQHGRAFFETEERAKPYRALRRVGQELDALTERLKVRFGRQHAVVTAFVMADEAVLEAFRALERVRLEPPAIRGDQYAEAQINELYERQVETIEGERIRFNEARDRFLDAAHGAAGAELSE